MRNDECLYVPWCAECSSEPGDQRTTLRHLFHRQTRLQLLDPIDDDGHDRQGGRRGAAACLLEHQKALAVRRYIVRTPIVAFEVEELIPVSRPGGSRPTISRYLPARRIDVWKWPDEHLVPAGFVGLVREPLAVRRNLRCELLRRGLQQRFG